MNLKAENMQLKEKILAYRKQGRKDYITCGRCGRDYHTLAGPFSCPSGPFSCPFCEHSKKNGVRCKAGRAL